MKTKRNLSASIPNETRKAVYARDGYRCALCDAVKKGDRVKVNFTIDGRRWDGPNGTRYFTDLTGWKIEVLNADGSSTEPVPAPAEAPEMAAAASDPDDLPF